MTTPTLERLVDPTAEQMMSHMVARCGPAREPASDLSDLATVLRRFVGVVHDRPTRERLGGDVFDVVITSSGAMARGVVAAMDEIQAGCGGVIEDPEAGWFYWLVPPNSARTWEPHPYAVCLGKPYRLTMPPLSRTAPPGPYWYRPAASDRLVPAGPLWTLLAQFRPEPAPHECFAAQFGTTP